MSKSRNATGLAVPASAEARFRSLLRAGGLSGHPPVAKGVSLSGNRLPGFQDLAADGAPLAFGKPRLGTGGRNRRKDLFGMSKSRNATGLAVPASAEARFCSLLRAGGLSGHYPIAKGVSLGSNGLLFQLFAAMVTDTIPIAVGHAGRSLLHNPARRGMETGCRKDRLRRNIHT